MSQFIFKRLDTIRELDDEECPGEVACLRKGPLNSHININYVPNEAVRLLRNPSQEIINEVCPRCPLFPTKPGNEPIEIKQALNKLLR